MCLQLISTFVYFQKTAIVTFKNIKRVIESMHINSMVLKTVANRDVLWMFTLRMLQLLLASNDYVHNVTELYTENKTIQGTFSHRHQVCPKK